VIEFEQNRGKEYSVSEKSKEGILQKPIMWNNTLGIKGDYQIRKPNRKVPIV